MGIASALIKHIENDILDGLTVEEIVQKRKVPAWMVRQVEAGEHRNEKAGLTQKQVDKAYARMAVRLLVEKHIARQRLKNGRPPAEIKGSLRSTRASDERLEAIMERLVPEPKVEMEIAS